MAYLAILFVLITAGSGILTFQANSAMPGDLLYPYKVSVNEEVERTFATTDSAKADWDLELLKERIGEALRLASLGKLDATAQTEVTQNINLHTKNITSTVASLQNQKKYQQAAQTMDALYATLSQETAQVTVLSSQGSPAQQLALAPVLVKLRTTLDTISLLSTRVEAQANGLPVPVSSGISDSASSFNSFK